MGKKKGALSAAQLRWMGEIASKWSHIELVLQFKIWLVLNVKPHVGMIITADMQSASLITLLKMLVMYCWKHDPRLKRVKELLEEIDALRIERNKAIHLVHADTEKGVLTIKLKRDPSLLRPKQFTAKELKEIAAKIVKTANELKMTQLPVAEAMPQKILKLLAEQHGWLTPSTDPNASARPPRPQSSPA